MSTDLFGQQIPDPRPPATDEAPDRVTNSVEEVLGVLRLACSEESYIVVGARQQIWRRLTDPMITPVPRYEADAVRQLLDAGWLILGGTHTYEHHCADVIGRSVLVPKRSRAWLLRWDNYQRLGQPGGGRR
ncbi:MAG: hypothetical protein ACRDRD_07780 [Pseudonocardiaceae bacterium]